MGTAPITQRKAEGWMHRCWKKLKEGRGDKNKTGRPGHAQRVRGRDKRTEFQASQGYKAINRLASSSVRPHLKEKGQRGRAKERGAMTFQEKSGNPINRSVGIV